MPPTPESRLAELAAYRARWETVGQRADLEGDAAKRDLARYWIAAISRVIERIR